MKPCPCKSWNKCTGYDWFSYQEFVYCRVQIIWFISNLGIFESGDWPRDPQETGYTDFSNRQLKAEGRFVKPAGMAADITQRLDRTGKDGRWLQWAIEQGTEIKAFPQECRDALNYICGRRKKMSYQTWLSQREYRKRRVIMRK